MTHLLTSNLLDRILKYFINLIIFKLTASVISFIDKVRLGMFVISPGISSSGRGGVRSTGATSKLDRACPPRPMGEAAPVVRP